MRGDAGQGYVEFAALTVLVGVIIAIVVATPVLGTIEKYTNSAVSKVLDSSLDKKFGADSSAAGSVSGKAGKAIAFARAVIGAPYVWGGVGPTSFDCSGLTMRAWQAAGVNIPRTAEAQYEALPKVNGAPQPGDLLYFHTEGGATATHTAIYIGQGKMIEAPHTGADVRVTDFAHSSYYQSTFVGARRPG